MDIINELEKYLLDEVIINQGSGRDTITPEEDLLSEGLVDSLGILKLTGFIEKKFGITIGDEDMEPDNFRNLLSLKRFIESKL